MNALNLKIYNGSPMHKLLEKAYLDVRGKEGRLYDDHTLKNLPQIHRKSAHYKEWLMRKDTLKRVEHYLKSRPSTPRLMDLGCGNGWMSASLANKGFSTTGVDINLEELKQADRVFHNPNLNFVYGDIFNDLPIGQFDIILISAALQYFKDPNKLINRLKHYLKEDGEILIADTFLYPPQEVKFAHQRTQEYFQKVGVTKMTSYYHHHSTNFLEKHQYQFLYQPEKKKRLAFSSKIESPFPLVQIKPTTAKRINGETRLSSAEGLQLKEAVMNKLLYFDLFRFPLNLSDFKSLLPSHYNLLEIQSCLDDLSESKMCYSYKGYYSLKKSIIEDIVEKRIGEETQANEFIKKLPFYIRLISRFPFVRAIAISGSLSKGVMQEGGDADYFIITKQNRLWLSRTLLILFKKVFLLNSKKYFCVNYFIGEDSLEIPDQNEFTATEIAFLIPVFGHNLINDFQEQNSWYKKYYPNKIQKVSFEDFHQKSWLKRFGEYILNNSFGDDIDNFFLHLTLRKWKEKFIKFDKTKFDLVLRSHKNVSKHHPQDYQSKVLNKLEERKRKVHKALYGELAG